MATVQVARHSFSIPPPTTRNVTMPSPLLGIINTQMRLSDWPEGDSWAIRNRESACRLEQMRRTVARFLVPILFCRGGPLSTSAFACNRQLRRDALSPKPADEVEIDPGQRSADLVHSTAYRE
jgi:hypothetical protein